MKLQTFCCFIPMCPSPASQSLPVSGLVIVCNLIVRHSYTSYTDISITGQRSEIRMVSGLVLSTVVGSTQTNMGVICTFSLTFFLIVCYVGTEGDNHQSWIAIKIQFGSLKTRKPTELKSRIATTITVKYLAFESKRSNDKSKLRFE